LISVSREAVAAAREQLRVAEAGLRAGTSPEFDVLRASVQVSNNRQGLVTAEANYRRTVASLAELVSLEPTTRLELVPVALPPEPDQVAVATARRALQADPADPEANGPAAPPATIIAPANEPASLPQSLETALAEAFTRRPEVFRAEWARRVAESRVRFERRGNLPSVGLGANFNFNPDQTGLAVEQQTYSIIANVAIPIWDAGLARARTRQARADVAAAGAQLRGARNNVAEEVRRALIDLEEARERRRAAVANTAQAREALRIAQVRYTAGLAPTVEVTDAEVALTQARTNEVNAAYDHVGSLANLNRSLGRYASDALALLPK
jgi:outer membrane protein TolC